MQIDENEFSESHLSQANILQDIDQQSPRRSFSFVRLTHFSIKVQPKGTPDRIRPKEVLDPLIKVLFYIK